MQQILWDFTYDCIIAWEWDFRNLNTFWFIPMKFIYNEILCAKMLNLLISIVDTKLFKAISWCFEAFCWEKYIFRYFRSYSVTSNDKISLEVTSRWNFKWKLTKSCNIKNHDVCTFIGLVITFECQIDQSNNALKQMKVENFDESVSCLTSCEPIQWQAKIESEIYSKN